jgi:hypothetical protein
MLQSSSADDAWIAAALAATLANGKNENAPIEIPVSTNVSNWKKRNHRL